jgi:hypothetical protein
MADAPILISTISLRDSWTTLWYLRSTSCSILLAEVAAPVGMFLLLLPHHCIEPSLQSFDHDPNNTSFQDHARFLECHSRVLLISISGKESSNSKTETTCCASPNCLTASNRLFNPFLLLVFLLCHSIDTGEWLHYKCFVNHLLTTTF